MIDLINNAFSFDHLDPNKTIFWIGVGIGGEKQSNLPMGNELTKTYLDYATGEPQAKILIDIWSYYYPAIRDCISQNG